MTHLDPARTIVQDLGGTAKVAALIGLHFTQVWRWTQPKEKGGTGGTIPQRHHLAILDIARSLDVPLTAADLLPRLPTPATPPLAPANSRRAKGPGISTQRARA